MPFDGLTSRPAVNRSHRAPGIVTAWPRPRKGGSGSHATALIGGGGRVEPGGPNRAGRKEHNLNRLHTASGKYGSRTYTYDNNSNRATEVIGSTTYTYSNTASKNLLASYTDGTNTRNFTYTANGNMATDDRTFIGGGSVSNTFGGRDRLESQTVNSQGVTFKVNAFGQRVSKAFSGTTTHYIHDIRGNIIAEANGSTGTTTMEYVWMEGQLLAQVDGSGNIVYVYSDYVNNSQKIANPSRTLVWDRIQEPFGEDYSTPTNTTPTNHRFPGQYADIENALSYNNARDYDKSIGRYIESDPMGLAAGPNLFGYAAQNPTQFTDPSGQILPLIAIAIGEAVIDAGAVEELSAGVAEVSAALLRARTVAVAGTIGTGALPLEPPPVTASPPPPEVPPATTAAATTTPTTGGVCVKPEGIPDDWRTKGTRTSGGIQYYDPTNPGNSVRIMPGNPNSPYPNSQVPYVRWQMNGQPLDSQGNVLPSSKAPDAHIPLQNFQFNPDIYK